jgi:hypothetical protein
MTQITKELALKICTKLRAKNITPQNAAHDKYGIFHGDILVGTIGIRRSPRKDQGHGHIPKELNVGPRFAWELGICTKSREDFLREIGVLGATPEAMPDQGSEGSQGVANPDAQKI